MRCSSRAIGVAIVASAALVSCGDGQDETPDTATSDDPETDSGVILRRDDGGWKIAFPLAAVSRFDSPPGIRPHGDEPHEGE